MRPTIDATQMATARLWAERSTCDRAHVGAVISMSGRTIGSGFNGAPTGMPHCNHTVPYVPIAGTNIDYNPISPLGRMPHPLGTARENACRVAIHAETNAIAYAARHGVAVEGATIYVTLSPCYSCAQLIIAAGLNRVVYDRAYRDTSGAQMLIDAGIAVEKWFDEKTPRT